MAIVVLVFLLIVVAAIVTAAHSGADVSYTPAAPRELVRRALTVVRCDEDGGIPRHLVDRIVETDPRVDIAAIADLSAVHPTLERVTPRVTRLRRASATTTEAALRAGATWGLQQGYDAIIELSAEHPTLACNTTALLEALDDGAHIAIGSRHVPGSRIRGARSRRLLSRQGNRALRYLTRVPLHDVTAPLRAYRREAVECGLACAEGPRGAFSIEVLLRCHRRGLRFAEVPVVATGAICAATSLTDTHAAVREALRWRRTTPRHPTLRALVRPVATAFGMR